MNFQCFKVLALALSALLAVSTISDAAPSPSSSNIVYSARYYLKLGQKGLSRYHLYRIGENGKERIQLTFGAHDDTTPRWSPDGKKIAFVRDGQWLCLANENGKNIRNFWNIKDGYWNGVRWSPDGKTIGLVHDAQDGRSSAALYLVNVQTRRAQRLANVEYFSWSPDGRKMALLSNNAGLRVLDVRSGKTVKSPVQFLTRSVWISPDRIVAAVSTKGIENGGIAATILLDAQGRSLRRFPVGNMGDEQFANWRSSVLPIPGNNQAFVFVSDQSTSSGHDAAYYRVSTIDGHMTKLGEGDFLSWSPNGQRFLLIPYHELTPFDTLRNGYKRVVYTQPLKVGDGKGKIKTIVSGMVYVESAQWR